MLHRKMACVCECTGINAYTGLRVTRDMWRSPANTKKSKSAILTIEKKPNPHTLKFEKSFSMTCFFLFSNIWMECVGKMGYFIGRCIFYNIIHISRLVEIIEYSICTNLKKKHISNVKFYSIIMIDYSIVWYYSCVAYPDSVHVKKNLKWILLSSVCESGSQGITGKSVNCQVWASLGLLYIFFCGSNDIYCCIPFLYFLFRANYMCLTSYMWRFPLNTVYSI